MIEPARSASENRLEPHDRPTSGTPAPRILRERGARTEPAPDTLERFQSLPTSEKVLFGAAVATLIAFLIEGGWTLLFRFGTLGGWFVTFALAGAAATFVLIALRTLQVPLFKPAVHARIVIALAMLPAIGLIIELLNHFWVALMLTGGGTMAWIAVRSFLTDDDEQAGQRPAA